MIVIENEATSSIFTDESADTMPSISLSA